MRVGGQVLNLEPLPELDKNKRHTLELVVDRLVAKPDIRKRLADSVELALAQGTERLIVHDMEQEARTASSPRHPFAPTCKSERAACQRRSCSLSMARKVPARSARALAAWNILSPTCWPPTRASPFPEQGAILPWKNERVLARQREAQLAGPRPAPRLRPWPHQSRSIQPRSLGAPCSTGDPEAIGWKGVTVNMMEMGQAMGSIWRDELSPLPPEPPLPHLCNGAHG